MSSPSARVLRGGPGGPLTVGSQWLRSLPRSPGHCGRLLTAPWAPAAPEVSIRDSRGRGLAGLGRDRACHCDN